MADYTQYSENEMHIVVWSNRAIFSITTIIIWYILIKECKKRAFVRKAMKGNKQRSTTTHKYQTMLNFWSLLSLMLVSMTSILYMLNKTPWICMYTQNIAKFISGFQYLTRMFFAVTRLQYTFASQSIHSKKFGYSKYVFILLWSWGILILCLHILRSTLVVPYEIFINGNSYGCSIESNQLYQATSFPGVALLWLYDFTILCLYIGKIRQFKKATMTNVHDQNHRNSVETSVHRRITVIMNKIIVLTLTIEISGVVGSVIGNAIWVKWLGPWGYLMIITLQSAPGLIIFAVVMFLMVEHNREIYNKLVGQYLIGYCRCHIWCCCCRNLLDIENMDEKNIAHLAEMNSGEPKLQNIKTNSSNNTDFCVSPKESDIVSSEPEISFDTKTVNPVEHEVNMRESADVSKLEIDI